MGTCQSRAADLQGGVPHTGFDGAIQKPVTVVTSTNKQSGSGGGITLIFPSKDSKIASLVSPSEKTVATVPETPSYQLSSPESNFSFVSPMPSGVDESACNTSRASMIESVISEEGSYEVPPSEEDDNLSVSVASSSHSAAAAASRRISNSVTEDAHPLSRPPSLGVASASPARMAKAQKRAEESARLHLLHSRMTTPESIVYRPAAPLIAPPKMGGVAAIPATVVGPAMKPKTSVNPQTIANFNRLKIQVQLAEQNEMHARRKAKLEDRFEDVKGYRNLWKDFENLKHEVEHKTVTPRRNDELENGAENTMNLKEPTTWYFDFQSLRSNMPFQRNTNGDDNDDTQSQASMSLLSEVSMEAQRKYYKEKRRERRKKKLSSLNHHLISIDTKKLKKSRSGLSDDKSVVSARSARSTNSRASAAYLRGKTDIHTGDYGPIREGDLCGLMDMSYDLGSDDSTPRTRTGRTNDDASRADGVSVTSELDLNNDYNVQRRRRPRNRHLADDSSLDTFDDNASRCLEGLALCAKVELDMNGFQPRVRSKSGDKHKATSRLSSNKKGGGVAPSSEGKVVVSMPNSPVASRIEQYGFDPSAPLSSQLELFAQSVPSVEIDDAKTGSVRWRNFPGTAEKTPAASRCLDGGFGTKMEEVDTSLLSKVPGQPPSASPVEHVSSDVVDDNVPSDAHNELVDPSRTKTQEVTVEIPATKPAIKPPSTFDFSPFDVMSPSHFLMMSSFLPPSTYDETETTSDAERDLAAGVPEQSIDDGMDGAVDGTEPGSSHSVRKVLKTYDPVISSLSTEAFLRMSAWQPSAPLMDCEAKDGNSAISNRARDSIPDIEVDADTSSSEESERNQGPAFVDGQVDVGDDSEDISKQVSSEVDALLEKFREDRRRSA